ncbi:MAG: hypothetical protein IKP86_06450 [Anaerolineaceae bacterium]|nr:hypothetical protein [Anaerolineaceae bacterium]
MENRHKIHPKERALVLTLTAASLATVLCAALLLQIPADNKNAFLFGLSKERLLMLSGFAVFFMLNVGCFFFRERLEKTFLSYPSLNKILVPAAVLSFFFLLMPDYRFGKYAAYFIRLKPYILWIFLTGSFFSLYLFYREDHFQKLRQNVQFIAQQKKFILPVLGFLLLLTACIEITGLGKNIESALWNKNGIPLQNIQLFVSIVIFALIRKTGLFKRLNRRRIAVNFFIIWAVSAIVWSLSPVESHFFAPGPYPPEMEYYPYSDASGYAVSAQTALNGWGFSFGSTVLKPPVAFITFLSQLITGNNFKSSMFLRSALFAVLPAIMYVFGLNIGGQGCGYMAAAFSLLKEWNALRTTRVLTVNSRLVMSEFLVQIILALFSYSIFKWLQNDHKRNLYAIIAGGTLTLGIFTRYNFAAFLPAGLLILFIGFRRNLRSLAKPLLYFFLTIVLTAAPMFVRDIISPESSMFGEIVHTVKDVLIRQRFQGKVPENNLSGVTEGTSGIVPGSETGADFPENQKEEFNTDEITQYSENNNSNKSYPLLISIFNHSFHNLISSFLTLPMELTFQDLDHLYSQEGDGLWRDNWDGKFSAKQWCFVGLWIILGSVTIGFLLKNQGISGFSILYFWAVYAFSIGFSRSSGGRYVVPTNWIPMLMLAYCCSLLISKEESCCFSAEETSLPVWKPVLSMAAFTAFFTAMVLFEKLTPAAVTSGKSDDLTILKERFSDHAEIDWDLVSDQYEEGVLHITHGKVVFPRFYYFRTGEHSPNEATMGKEYSRMTFTGINKDSSGILRQDYLLPHTEMISDFPQDSVFRAISCSSDVLYQDVLAVTVESPDGRIFSYVRDPLPEFSCPVPEPVCTAVESCR